MKFPLVTFLLAGVAYATPAFSDGNYKDYANSIKLLTLSDPKPAIANIAGGFGAGHG